MYNNINSRLILKIRLLISGLVLFFNLDTLKAQEGDIPITTGTISTSAFCAGETVDVPFTTMGMFDPGNEFFAQLSDATGSFSNPIYIGSLEVSARSSTVSAVIPSNIPAGTGYRIRVVATRPESIGTDNGTDLTIYSNSTISSVTSDLNNICPNTSVKLTANGVIAGTGAELIWYDGPVEGATKEVGRSNPLTVSPSTTTTYFAVLDGQCNYVEVPVTVKVVEDVTPPVVITSDTTIQLNSAGKASIEVGQIDNGSWDNCGIAARELDLTDFSCSDAGDHEVILTVTDNNGNIATGTAIVSIVDNTPPAITCIEDIITSDPVVTYDLPVATDNCSDVTIDLIEGIETGMSFPVGSTKVTFRATDKSGNTNSCSFTVTVNEPNNAPTDILLSNTIISNNPGGGLVGVFSTIDEDAKDIHTYTVVSQHSSQPDGLFSIQGDQLVINHGFEEYLSQVKSLIIKVRSTDSKGAFVEKIFLFSVDPEKDLNDFPTAFTPNGDGVNDVWDVGENQIDPGAYVWIYDDNSQLVFKSVGYKEPWDGNYKGKPQPVGTYYYIIELNGKKQREGFVTILK